MKLIFDVYYDEDSSTATTAAVAFNSFTDSVESGSYIDVSPIMSEYIPGEFYKRELPAILSLIRNRIGLDVLERRYDTIVVDGLYMLSDTHKGLGARLKDYLLGVGIDIEVVGIAKTHFNGCERIAQSVYRGLSKRPLFVNGSGTSDYAKLVESMAGTSRIPYLVKKVDKLCRHTLMK